MNLLSIDLRDNPGYYAHQSHNLQIMKYSFLRNIRNAVKCYFKFKHRIKLEWVFPNAVGIKGNDLDDKNPSALPIPNRNLFNSLIQDLSNELEYPFHLVIKAFIGAETCEQKELIQKLISQQKTIQSEKARSKKRSSITTHKRSSISINKPFRNSS